MWSSHKALWNIRLHPFTLQVTTFMGTNSSGLQPDSCNYEITQSSFVQYIKSILPKQSMNARYICDCSWIYSGTKWEQFSSFSRPNHKVQSLNKKKALLTHNKFTPLLIAWLHCHDSIPKGIVVCSQASIFSCFHLIIECVDRIARELDVSAKRKTWLGSRWDQAARVGPSMLCARFARCFLFVFFTCLNREEVHSIAGLLS